MRIVFLGSADFGIAALQLLHKNHSIVGIVSIPPRPFGRGLKYKDSPIVSYAKKEQLSPIFTPDNLTDTSFIEQLKGCNADCFVVVAFRLLPRSVFTIPSLGTINIHASLLPAYRGPAPIQRAIEAGEKESGITIFRIDEGIDTGEILQQEALPIGVEETTPELYLRLSTLGAEVLQKTLYSLEHGEVTPRKQVHSLASRAPKLKKSEAIIDWNLSAETIFNKIRAFKPFPGTATLCKGRRLGIEWALPYPSDNSATPCGTVVSIGDRFFDVQSGNGVLRVVAVKPEGRKSLTSREFLNGSVLAEGYAFNE